MTTTNPHIIEISPDLERRVAERRRNGKHHWTRIPWYAFLAIAITVIVWTFIQDQQEIRKEQQRKRLG